MEAVQFANLFVMNPLAQDLAQVSETRKKTKHK